LTGFALTASHSARFRASANRVSSAVTSYLQPGPAALPEGVAELERLIERRANFKP
jgi:hypothetical protein